MEEKGHILGMERKDRRCYLITNWVNNKTVDFSATSGICKLVYLSPYHYPGDKLHTKKPRDDEHEKL